MSAIACWLLGCLKTEDASAAAFFLRVPPNLSRPTGKTFLFKAYFSSSFGIGLNMESRLWPIRRALQGVSPVWKNAPSGLLRRDTAPAVCFDDCGESESLIVGVRT